MCHIMALRMATRATAMHHQVRTVTAHVARLRLATAASHTTAARSTMGLGRRVLHRGRTNGRLQATRRRQTMVQGGHHHMTSDSQKLHRVLSLPRLRLLVDTRCDLATCHQS